MEQERREREERERVEREEKERQEQLERIKRQEEEELRRREEEQARRRKEERERAEEEALLASAAAGVSRPALPSNTSLGSCPQFWVYPPTHTLWWFLVLA